MELGQSLGIIAILIISAAMLIWQNKMWNEGDLKRYNRNHPPDYISFEVTYRNETPEWFKILLSEFIYRVTEGMGLSGGGVGGPEGEKFHFEDMINDQSDALRDVIDLFAKAAGIVVFVDCWQGFNREEEEDD